jgi:hypothetical protein
VNAAGAANCAGASSVPYVGRAEFAGVGVGGAGIGTGRTMIRGAVGCGSGGGSTGVGTTRSIIGGGQHGNRAGSGGAGGGDIARGCAGSHVM